MSTGDKSKVERRGCEIRSFCLERLADPELSQRDTWFWKVARLVALSDTSTSFDGEPCDRTKEGSCLCGREWSWTMLNAKRRERAESVTGGTCRVKKKSNKNALWTGTEPGSISAGHIFPKRSFRDSRTDRRFRAFRDAFFSREPKAVLPSHAAT